MFNRFSFRVEDQRESSGRVPPTPPRSGGRESVQPPRNQERPAGGDGAEDGMEVEGVYVISVAARLLDMHPQTLRKYERLGLVNPVRTVGMLRLYSREDIRKVMLIRHLTENLGLNLAGVEFVLNLVDNLGGFRRYLENKAEGSPLQPVIGQAMAQLYRNLNLPVEE